MTVGDVYYVLFRHKWKIIVLSIAGIVAAVANYYLNPPPYQSAAELMIQYVPEATAQAMPGSDQKVIVPDSGYGVISSEIQILMSLDLAKLAATNIGPAAILSDVNGGSNAITAAGIIRNNLMAQPIGNGSSVILVTFKHPDPRIVQPVLQEVINDYLQRHKEIHSPPGGFDEALSREQASLSVQLNDTEKQIADLENHAGIINLDDARRSLADQISRIKSSILDAQAGLAGYQAATKQSPTAPAPKSETTNAAPTVPQEQIDAYNAICADLDAIRKKQQTYLLMNFTKSNAFVMEADAQLATVQKAKADLEEKYPQLLHPAASSPAAVGWSGPLATDLQDEIQATAMLQAKLEAWTNTLNQLQLEATNLNSLAPVLAQLGQVKAIQQANLQILSEALERSHINSALDTGKTPNIKSVQLPSPPFRDWHQTYKTMMSLALGGIAAGLGWAFFIEFFLDRTVRRPIEIESKLKMPLFLSIPDIARNGHTRAAAIAGRQQRQLQDATLPPNGDGASSPGKTGALQVVSLEHTHPAMQTFCEALRDRLIVYFEVKNLTHKPKLLAVTSAGHGAGVSTIAAGLAASLSETGDGNVLLVDMNAEQGAAQQFYKGKAGCGLDKALAPETKQDALVQENLYVVNGNVNSAELPRILPKRFSALVPKLKASDYDYIIFDMPPVSQTSLTSRLSRFMDMTLLVVESEKTGREVVQQANTWLVESGATVGAVLNKTRRYVPEKLHQEYLGDR